MRNSSADQLILETLGVQKSHLTSHQIYEGVHLRLPALNPSTVYRALDRLVSQGKVTVSDMGLGAAVFELAGEKPHHHLVCQGCGYITMIADDQIAPLMETLEKNYHYKIKTNHLVLFGLCEQCQQNH
ncbi:MAG: transcriptional repressor [Chloroflexi bacterium HGW-Chloroflexi-4]|jgi:Fur family ferric uptake transcriptional regulator|nr:MAG: transcriptional repressor [Chloroflexi bacterium HGW-Chloroflexi-4]